MTNEQIDSYVFNDPVLDQMPHFDYCLRSDFIEGKITKSDYLVVESLLSEAMRLKSKISETAFRGFVEALSNS